MRRACGSPISAPFSMSAGRKDEARELLQRAAESAHSVGYESLEMDALMNLAEIDLYARDFESAYRAHTTALPHARDGMQASGWPIGMGWAALGLDRRAEARGLFLEALERILDAETTSHYDFTRAFSQIALATEVPSGATCGTTARRDCATARAVRVQTQGRRRNARALLRAALHQNPRRRDMGTGTKSRRHPDVRRSDRARTDTGPCRSPDRLNVRPSGSAKRLIDLTGWVGRRSATRPGRRAGI